MKREGSCNIGKPNCRFSHDIPACVRENPEVAANIIGQRNLCVNHFFSDGSCRRGDRCRFHHQISDAQRENPRIIEIMKEKQRKMYQQKERSEMPICVYEFAHEGACHRKDQCNFNHEISETERKDPALAAEIKTRLLNIQNLRKLRASSGPNDKRQESVTVPKIMLEKMYELLDKSPAQSF